MVFLLSTDSVAGFRANERGCEAEATVRGSAMAGNYCDTCSGRGPLQSSPHHEDNDQQ